MRCVIPGRSVKREFLCRARFDKPLFAFLSFFSLFVQCLPKPSIVCPGLVMNFI